MSETKSAPTLAWAIDEAKRFWTEEYGLEITTDDASSIDHLARVIAWSRRTASVGADAVAQPIPSTFVLHVAARDPFFRKWMVEQLQAMGDKQITGEFKSAEYPSSAVQGSSHRIRGEES